MVKIALPDPKYTRFTAKKEKKMAKIASMLHHLYIDLSLGYRGYKGTIVKTSKSLLN